MKNTKILTRMRIGVSTGLASTRHKLKLVDSPIIIIYYYVVMVVCFCCFF